MLLTLAPSQPYQAGAPSQPYQAGAPAIGEPFLCPPLPLPWPGAPGGPDHLATRAQRHYTLAA